MQYVIIEDQTVVTIQVDKEWFPMAIEAPDDIVCGDSYYNGDFQRVSPRRELVAWTPSQLRERAYETMLFKEDGVTPLILWQGEAITVDMANGLWLVYQAENSPMANQLQEMIVIAKKCIRQLTPD